MVDTQRLAKKRAIKIAKTDGDCLLPHLRWDLEQVMSRVRPEDLSDTEIAALLDTLRLAHCRVMGRPAPRPGLRVLGVGG